MLRLFRKIRISLMEQRKTRSYIFYALGEIILVMIGILLALQVNNWNEQRKSDLRKQEYYRQLLEDLNSDLKFTKSVIEEFNIYLDNYSAYTESYRTNLLTPEQVYKQISQLPLISQPLTFSTSTIETLLNSGDLRLLPSNIRNKLIDLMRLQNLTIGRFEHTNRGMSNITQNISLLIGSTTLPARLTTQPEMSNFLKLEDKMKEMILLYEGIHRWKSITELEAKERLEYMLGEINTLVSLITKELN